LDGLGAMTAPQVQHGMSDVVNPIVFGMVDGE
jgi:hypothetical protein